VLGVGFQVFWFDWLLVLGFSISEFWVLDPPYPRPAGPTGLVSQTLNPKP